MKNIIKPGYKSPKTKPIYEATCGCGCVFEFDDEEITQRTKNLNIPNTIWVECPCCGKELEIYNPKIVREEAINVKIDEIKINHKKASELLTQNGVVVIDRNLYEKMEKQLEVVQEKVIPLVHITGHYEEGTNSYEVSDNEGYESKDITKEEYDLLLDLKRGNKNKEKEEC